MIHRFLVFKLLFEAGDQPGTKSNCKEEMDSDAANADSGDACWHAYPKKKRFVFVIVCVYQ